MKHIKKFETVAAFEAVQATLDKPNVSYVTEIGGVNYLPYNPFTNDPYIDDPKLVVIYNVTSTEEDTFLFNNNYDMYIISMEIDGVELNEVVNTYRFNTIGEHVIKYEYLIDTFGEDQNPLGSLFSGSEQNDNNEIFAPQITKIYIPSSITGLGYGGGYTFIYDIYLEFISLPNTISAISCRTFYNCSNLSTIRCNNMIAPQIEDNDIFENISQTGTLYVPTGATGYDTWLTELGAGWTKVEF